MEKNMVKIIRVYYRDASDRIRLLPFEDAVLACGEVARTFNMLCALFPSDNELLGRYGSAIWDSAYESFDSSVVDSRKEIETAELGLYE